MKFLDKNSLTNRNNLIFEKYGNFILAWIHTDVSRNEYYDVSNLIKFIISNWLNILVDDWYNRGIVEYSNTPWQYKYRHFFTFDFLFDYFIKLLWCEKNRIDLHDYI